VQAANDHGVQERLDTKKVSKPNFIIDAPEDHAFWGQVDETARNAERAIKLFSAPDSRRSFHLVPMSKGGDLIAHLRNIRHQRIDLVIDFARNHWEEYIANLRAKFPAHFYLLEPQLFKREELVEKFDMLWTLHPLTPIDPSRMKFSDINAADRAAIIEESNRMAQRLVQQRATAIYEEVFGTMLRQCDDIARGALATGKRKFGGITELIDGLQRMQNFREFCNDPAIIQHADNAISLLSGITDISQVNANEGRNPVTQAIQTAFRPLGQAIDRMMKDVSRSSRSVEI